MDWTDCPGHNNSNNPEDPLYCDGSCRDGWAPTNAEWPGWDDTAEPPF